MRKAPLLKSHLDFILFAFLSYLLYICHPFNLLNFSIRSNKSFKSVSFDCTAIRFTILYREYHSRLEFNLSFQNSLLQKNNFLKSIERKSSALIPPSPTIKADCGLKSLRNLSNPSVRFSALLFTSMATTEPFLRRTKSTSSSRSRQ